MTLLSETMGDASLLTEHRTRWERTRRIITGRSDKTGAPITTTTRAHVLGWFTWVTPDTRQDYRADTIAMLLTTPGQLKPDDLISNAQIGTFLVLEAGVNPNGPFDRAELRRAGPP